MAEYKDNIFTYNTSGKLELNCEYIGLLGGFDYVLSFDYNKCPDDPTGQGRFKATALFKYMFLNFSYRSPFRHTSYQKRAAEAKKEAGLLELEVNLDDPNVAKAVNLYKREFCSHRAFRAYMAAETLLDKMISYYETLDPSETDEKTGRPLFKSSELSKIPDDIKMFTDGIEKNRKDLENALANESNARGQKKLSLKDRGEL